MLCRWDASIITSLLYIVTSLLYRPLLLPIISHFSLPNLQMTIFPAKRWFFLSLSPKRSSSVQVSYLTSCCARRSLISYGPVVHTCTLYTETEQFYTFGFGSRNIGQWNFNHQEMKVQHFQPMPVTAILCNEIASPQRHSFIWYFCVPVAESRW